MKDPYIECPVLTTKSFTLRLIEQTDAKDLFDCYHDKKAVSYMNDDNCDFGFYVDTPENMETTVKYWIKFYNEKYFIRFAIVDNAVQKVVGTVEGFIDDTGVLRVDIRQEYEKAEYLSEIFELAAANFKEMFQNKSLVTKAVREDTERRSALEKCEWEFIDEFREYKDYYKIEL